MEQNTSKASATWVLKPTTRPTPMLSAPSPMWSTIRSLAARSPSHNPSTSAMAIPSELTSTPPTAPPLFSISGCPPRCVTTTTAASSVRASGPKMPCGRAVCASMFGANCGMYCNFSAMSATLPGRLPFLAGLTPFSPPTSASVPTCWSAVCRSTSMSRISSTAMSAHHPAPTHTSSLPRSSTTARVMWRSVSPSASASWNWKAKPVRVERGCEF